MTKYSKVFWLFGQEGIDVGITKPISGDVTSDLDATVGNPILSSSMPVSDSSTESSVEITYIIVCTSKKSNQDKAGMVQACCSSDCMVHVNLDTVKMTRLLRAFKTKERNCN